MLGFQGGVSIPLVKGGVKSPAREAPVSSRAEGRGSTRLYLGLDRRSREEFPRPLALQRAFRQALLARSPQQGTAGIAEPAFNLVVRPGQTRHVVAVEQPGPIAPAARVEMMAKLT